MAFLTSSKYVENQVLQGANSPREVIVRNALRVARPATNYEGGALKNASAQNYRGAMAGSKDVTNVQAQVVNAIIHRKMGSGTNPGVASWKGRLFGG